jgi:alpha-1,2-mannosyltransferase
LSSSLLETKRTEGKHLGRTTYFVLSLQLTCWGSGIVFASALPLLSAPFCGVSCATQGFRATFASFFRSDSALADSWTPIANVLRYLASNSPEGLYQATYWQSDNQFIYSPLSIVFYRLTNWPPVLDWLSPLSLNRFSWWIFWGVVILIVVMFNDFHKILGVDAKPIDLRERISRILIPLVAALLYYPLQSGRYVGNIQTWLTFLIILSLLLWMRGNRTGVGACLGLVCIFKPVFMPILLWALLRREYLVIIGFLAKMIPFGLASLIMFGFGVHWEYLDLMAYLSRRGESFGSQSVNSLLNRAILNGPILEWDGTHSHIQYVTWIHYATIATTWVGIGAALIGRRQRSPVASWIDYAIALLSLTIAAPVVYEHHIAFTVILFMVAGVMLCHESSISRPILWILAISYVLVAFRFDIITTLAITHFNFLLTHRLFGSLILLVILYRLRAGWRGRATAFV